MKHQYLFTLEITPLEVGRAYKELPSHLTLMSRFLSDLSYKELALSVQPLFAKTKTHDLVFGETTELGPKKLTVHMVRSAEEDSLHIQLKNFLDSIDVTYQYPQFVGQNHKAHVTKREGVYFAEGDVRKSSAAYLIEIVDSNRLVRAKFEFNK